MKCVDCGKVSFYSDDMYEIEQDVEVEPNYKFSLWEDDSRPKKRYICESCLSIRKLMDDKQKALDAANEQIRLLQEQLEKKNQTKACAVCSEAKPLEQFSANKLSKDGRIHTCKSCVKKSRDAKKEPKDAKNIVVNIA